MRRIERSAAFKRDYRRAKAISRYRDLDERLVAALELLVNDRPLPPRSRDHTLSANWSRYRDYYLWPDLLLIYAKPAPDVLRLVRLGSHSDLFEQSANGEPFAPAAGLSRGTPYRLPGTPRGMLSSDSGVVTEMRDGPRDDDLMIVPAGGTGTSTR